MTKKRAAVFTLQQNERYHLPLWLAYYGQFFQPQDIYVLDHDSTDPETKQALRNSPVNVLPVHHELTFDHTWLLDTVHAEQKALLGRYEYVLFTDVDEWLIPADGDLRAFIDAADQLAYRATAYEVIEDRQRRWPVYDKTLLARMPLTWIAGYHETSMPYPNVPASDDLFLYHLHRLNRQAALDKLNRWSATKVDPVARANNMAWQNFALSPEEEFDNWFTGDYEKDAGGRTMGEPMPLDDRLAAALDRVATSAPA